MQRKKPFIWRDHDSSDGGDDGSQAEEAEDDDGGEEIEERAFNRAHALRTLRSLEVRSDEEPPPPTPPPSQGRRGRGGAAANDDVPRVPLREHIEAVRHSLSLNRYTVSDDSSVDDAPVPPPPCDDDDDEGARRKRKRDTSDDEEEDVERPRRKRRKHEERPQSPPPAPLTIEERRRRRYHCFLCSYGDRYHDGIEAKHALKMHEMMNNYGGCSNEVLAQHLALYYEYYVYRPESGLPRFTREEALEHIEQHTLAAEVFSGESIRQMLDIRLGLAQLIFKQNGRHCKDALNGFIQVQKLLNRQYTLRPEQMIFNQGKSSDDVRKQGQYFNFMPIFKERADRNARVAREQERLNQKLARLIEQRETEDRSEKRKRKNYSDSSDSPFCDEYDV